MTFSSRETAISLIVGRYAPRRYAGVTLPARFLDVAPSETLCGPLQPAAMVTTFDVREVDKPLCWMDSSKG